MAAHWVQLDIVSAFGTCGWKPHLLAAKMAASTLWRHASQRASQGGILPPTDAGAFSEF